jgi:hypothetical protein
MENVCPFVLLQYCKEAEVANRAVESIYNSDA